MYWKGHFCSQPSLRPKSAMSTIDILGLGCVTSIYSPLMPSPVDIGQLHFQGTKGDNRYKIIDKEWYNRSINIQEYIFLKRYWVDT